VCACVRVRDWLIAYLGHLRLMLLDVHFVRLVIVLSLTRRSVRTARSGDGGGPGSLASSLRVSSAGRLVGEFATVGGSSGSGGGSRGDGRDGGGSGAGAGSSYRDSSETALDPILVRGC